jgi:hypothetical protein
MLAGSFLLFPDALMNHNIALSFSSNLRVTNPCTVLRLMKLECRNTRAPASGGDRNGSKRKFETASYRGFGGELTASYIFAWGFVANGYDGQLGGLVGVRTSTAQSACIHICTGPRDERG